MIKVQKLWKLWCNAVDEHPFKTLFVLFIFVYIFEGGAHGLWVQTLVLFIISLGLSITLSITLKSIFKVSRGFEIKKIMDYRFPSAHTLIATTLCTVASLLDNILALPLFIFLILTAYSRVYINAHKVVDVIAGFLMGLLLGIGIYLSYCFL